MPSRVRVLFVCQHGAAKSVIAREHFARLADAAGYDVDVASAGLEPDPVVPDHVVEGLLTDGLDVDRGGRVPGALTAAALADADIVVSLGCPGMARDSARPSIQWDDLPAVSDGYDPARTAIVARLGEVLAALATIGAQPRPRAPSADQHV